MRNTTGRESRACRASSRAGRAGAAGSAGRAGQGRQGRQGMLVLKAHRARTEAVLLVWLATQNHYSFINFCDIAQMPLRGRGTSTRLEISMLVLAMFRLMYYITKL